jgi:hypothetical protein
MLKIHKYMSSLYSVIIVMLYCFVVSHAFFFLFWSLCKYTIAVSEFYLLSALFLQCTASTYLLTIKVWWVFTNKKELCILLVAPGGRNIGFFRYWWCVALCVLSFVSRTIRGVFYCHNGYGCVKKIVDSFFRFLMLNEFIPLFVYMRYRKFLMSITW